MQPSLQAYLLETIRQRIGKSTIKLKQSKVLEIVHTIYNDCQRSSNIVQNKRLRPYAPK